MLFNLNRIACQLFDLFVSQLLSFALFLRDRYFLHVAAGFTDQFDFLRIDRLFQYFQFIFGNQIIIRGHSALHHIFAQAVCAFDQYVLVFSIGYVNGEHDTGSF